VPAIDTTNRGPQQVAKGIAWFVRRIEQAPREGPDPQRQSRRALGGCLPIHCGLAGERA
jgi:hypothetical protein